MVWSLKDREVPEWPRFWTDYRGVTYHGTDKQLAKLKKEDKMMRSRISKIKKIQDAIHSRG